LKVLIDVSDMTVRLLYGGERETVEKLTRTDSDAQGNLWRTTDARRINLNHEFHIGTKCWVARPPRRLCCADITVQTILCGRFANCLAIKIWQHDFTKNWETVMTLSHTNIQRHADQVQQAPTLSACNLVLDQTPGTALEVLESHASAKSCVVLTGNPCPEYLTDLLARAPAALLANGETLEQTLKALEVVAGGGRVINLPKYPQDMPAPLTPCERLVLRLVTRAQCDKRIARQLGISDGTVRKRISEILDKIGLENRMQLGYYYLGLWSFLDTYRDRMPIRVGEHLWGLGGTNVHFANGSLKANLGEFGPMMAFGHFRAPQAGSGTGGFMIREVSENETLEVVGGWVPNPRSDNPDLREGTPHWVSRTPSWRGLDPMPIKPQIPFLKRMMMANGQG
jgi:DNA-binding NarL/FixJ family response regulator